MLPESELTPTQIAARRIIEERYGKNANQYYQDRLIIIGSWEVFIRDKPSGLSDEERESMKLSQQHIIQQCGELGIPVDLDTLYEAEKNKPTDTTQSPPPPITT